MFDLFSTQPINALPYDGEVYYFGPVLNQSSANHCYQTLLNTIDWQPDRALINGELIETQRKYALFGDKAFSYRYSMVTRTAKYWPDELMELKQICEQTTQQHYNACLLNLYESGQQAMSWHSDAEKDLVEQGSIASLSLGAQRTFAFKHKQTSDIRKIILEHGSLLEMKGQTQTHWLHQLPKMMNIDSPRINLTFRQMR